MENLCFDTQGNGWPEGGDAEHMGKTAGAVSFLRGWAGEIDTGGWRQVGSLRLLARRWGNLTTIRCCTLVQRMAHCIHTKGTASRGLHGMCLKGFMFIWCMKRDYSMTYRRVLTI